MRKQLSLIILVMCVCLGAMAQVPPVLRGPWTTNTPGSINAYATNTTIRTNLSVSGPTDSYLFQVNTNQFAVTNKNAILGPLGLLGQGKEYGTPADNFSGYVQPYNSSDGYTRIWNTGPFGIFFGTDNQTEMRLDSPGNLSILGSYRGNGSLVTNYYGYPMGVQEFYIPKTRLVYEGDSLSGCCGWVYLVTNYTQFRSALSISNVSAGGSTLANIIADYATQVLPNAPTAPTQAILHVWVGANDYAIADPYAYAYSLSNYWQTARADGFAVVAFTVTPSIYWQANSTRSSNWFVINDQIRQSTNWNYLVDVATMFPDYNSTNYTDGVHLSISAYQRVAGEVDNLIRNGPRNDSWIVGVSQAALKEGTNIVLRAPSGQALVVVNTAQFNIPSIVTMDASGTTFAYTPNGLSTGLAPLKSGTHYLYYGGNYTILDAMPDGSFKAYNAANYDFTTFSFADSAIASRLFITNGGNVGIGFTNPAQALSVKGNISSSGTINASNGVI